MDNWDHINAVARMQDFIQTNIGQPLTLFMLARAAGYSPWYCDKIFRELTGRTPFDYIRSLRLSQAALQLRDNPGRVIDVALDFVFDSHEGFTRAFGREFGISPKCYMKNPPPIKLFMPNNVRHYYLTIQKGALTMPAREKPATVFVQVIERPTRKLIIRRGIKASNYYEYCDEVDCEIWGILCSIKEALYEPIGLWLPPVLIKTGTSVYAQGVEVAADYSGVIPDGCDLIDLAPCKMMVFQGQPFDDEDFEEAITDLWAVMQDYKPEIYGFQWSDEDGPRFQLEPRGYRGYIEARPVKDRH